METFIDKHSKYIFSAKSGNECIEHMKVHGIFEYSLIDWCQQYLNHNSLFIDIGANIGTYSVILSKYCKEVHAFECSPDTYQNLNNSIKLNHMTNIVTHQEGLGDEEKESIFYLTSADGGTDSLIDVPGYTSGQITVQIKTLDSFKLTNIGFIKIDVENYELEVLKGAQQTLKNSNYPPIIFEANHDEWYKEKKLELFKFIISLGYKIHPINGYGNMYLASDHL